MLAVRASATAEYRRRTPEREPLYQALAGHLETFLVQHRAHDQPLPRYVEQELRAYLECGILAYGFVRVRCSAYGESRLVAFSCKKRGFYPSCLGRRMADTAAHLVDHVLPRGPRAPRRRPRPDRPRPRRPGGHPHRHPYRTGQALAPVLSSLARPSLPPRPDRLPRLRQPDAPHRRADRPRLPPHLPRRRRPRLPAATHRPGPPAPPARLRLRRLSLTRPGPRAALCPTWPTTPPASLAGLPSSLTPPPKPT